MANKPVSAISQLASLDILLRDQKVGTLVRTPGDFNGFSFTPEYRTLKNPPILSLSFQSAEGTLRSDARPVSGRLPPFFANLLPEEKLREAMEKHYVEQVRPGNDFDLLAALGTNLPGAVRALPSDGSETPSPKATESGQKVRFSLAGVQMKLSVMKNEGKGGGITLAVDDGEGHYIAKFPSLNNPGVSENEFAILALAEALGMEVPVRELVNKDQFAGIPEEFSTLSNDKVLLIRRFDRDEKEGRIHIEDFAQVFGKYPSQKYDGGSYHNIADAINRAVSADAAIEFTRRLALAVAVGNGDMHLKNWSLIYPGEGRTPVLAPVYDVLSTIPYIPKDSMALTLGGEKSFKALTPERWANFAARAKLPQAAVLNAVREIAAAVDTIWWKLPEREVVPQSVIELIDAHVKAMLPILSQRN